MKTKAKWALVVGAIIVFSVLWYWGGARHNPTIEVVLTTSDKVVFKTKDRTWGFEVMPVEGQVPRYLVWIDDNPTPFEMPSENRRGFGDDVEKVRIQLDSRFSIQKAKLRFKFKS